MIWQELARSGIFYQHEKFYNSCKLLFLLVEQSGIEPPTSSVRGIYSTTIPNKRKSLLIKE